jgi:hypothetical protein
MISKNNSPELIKNYRVTLFETQILITKLKSRNRAFQANPKFSEGKAINILDKDKFGHSWIDTKQKAMNYYECCGVLILFGIKPPSFENLESQLVE